MASGFLRKFASPTVPIPYSLFPLFHHSSLDPDPVLWDSVDARHARLGRQVLGTSTATCTPICRIGSAASAYLHSPSTVLIPASLQLLHTCEYLRLAKTSVLTLRTTRVTGVIRSSCGALVSDLPSRPGKPCCSTPGASQELFRRPDSSGPPTWPGSGPLPRRISQLPFSFFFSHCHVVFLFSLFPLIACLLCQRMVSLLPASCEYATVDWSLPASCSWHTV